MRKQRLFETSDEILSNSFFKQVLGLIDSRKTEKQDNKKRKNRGSSGGQKK